MVCAIAVRVEDRLQLLLQQHRRCGLGNSVCRVGHPEHSDPLPLILRYLHRTHRSGEVASRTHPVPQLVEVVGLVGCEPLDAHGVHARRSAVRLDPLPRLVDEALSNLKGLHLPLRSLPRLLPRRVGHRANLDCPAPWLQPHYKAFIATTNRSASVPRIGTLPLAVFAACGSPSCDQGLPAPISTGRRYRDDRFSCSKPAPATSSCHLYTGHHQGNVQAAPWLKAHPTGHADVPGHPQTPVSMPT